MADENPRINKYIALSGLCSRRKADDLILSGAVKVNGKVVDDLSLTVSKKDKVCVNGKLIVPQKEFTYIKYYKPAGYITTKTDEKNRKTIYDILPEEVQNLKPVGRLDKDSTGLLIMTDDGDLINKMTHPSVKIPKVYRVCVEGRVTRNNLLTLAGGIEIEKEKMAYADAQIIEFEDKNTVLNVVLYQGLNRQIRKMAEFIGHPVISLKRIQHGTIDLSGLKRGAFKYLKPSQIKDLKIYLKSFEKKDKKSAKREQLK